jgi:acyl-homoserine-lactone acylase
MLPPALLLAAVVVASPAPVVSSGDVARWEREARAVTVTRDDWGIAHVHGKTDADAVFGMEYAQAEDDFPRVEMNYVKALGRRAEADGDTAIFEDLRMKLFVDPDTLKADYRTSPQWLKRLMDAFADGLNYYLSKHPDVHPRVIQKFEPWMALSFTEGSIGGDIERVSVPALAAFYGNRAAPAVPGEGDGPVGALPPPAAPEIDDPLREPDGSNGIAVAPALARDHHALLWINPHTSFYFRSELQMSSDEGLDAYGAVTWGQFFVYQGFNRTCGWMHTSSGVDNIDEFLEAVGRSAGRLLYDVSVEGHGDNVRHMEDTLAVRTITVPYRTKTGMAKRTFTAYFTRHGPVVRRQGQYWVSVSLMNRPVAALTQSYTRTKAADLGAFEQVMELHANSSNNTLFADAKGDIAYFHSNYIPVRDQNVDWTAPVNGWDPRTGYHGLFSVDESPNAVNPKNGWVYNSNNWPWSCAGTSSPRREAFPRYVETGTEETPRGLHALRLLDGSKDWTMTSLARAAFDSYLPAFERLVPPLLAAYDHVPPADPRWAKLADEIAALRGWDFRWAEGSIPTTLAIYWAERAVRAVTPSAAAAHVSAQTYIATRAGADTLLAALAAASDTLTQLFGTWKTGWGEINRFQRIDERIDPHFDDAEPSLAVPFTSGIWGSLASFGAHPWPGTKRWYGSTGNSFLAAVEFGDTLRAIAVTCGGASGHRDSPHFADQAERYIQGNLREVYFHPWQLTKHTARSYHPGE